MFGLRNKLFNISIFGTVYTLTYLFQTVGSNIYRLYIIHLQVLLGLIDYIEIDDSF